MTPIAHTSVGIGARLFFSRPPGAGETMAFIAVANLPDLDFLLRIIPAVREAMPHQYATHNLVFALLSCLLFFGVVREPRMRWALASVALSHPFLDLMVSDTVPPIGFPMLWPFSERLFHVGGFPALYRGDLATLFSRHNLTVVLLEVSVFALPLLFLGGKRLWGFIREWDVRRRG